MRYPKCLTRNLMLCALPLAASACAPRVQLKPIFPPTADLKAIVTPKPVAGPEIVTSAKASAEYDIAVEKWGDTISSAGGIICRWVIDQGGKLPFDCPKAP